MKVNGIIPMLETKNLKHTIEFYNVLGFVCKGFYPDEENACWASLWNGDCEIAFSLKAEKNAALTGSIYIQVQDVEEVWQKLKDKVEIVYPIENMNYGMREFGIRDNNGYLINLGQDILEN